MNGRAGEWYFRAYLAAFVVIFAAFYRSATGPQPLSYPQVLTYIYQLRQWRTRPGFAVVPPQPPQVGDVPGGEPDPAP